MNNTVTINGQQYKIGLKGHVFVYRCGEWQLDLNVTAGQVTRALEAQRRRIARK